MPDCLKDLTLMEQILISPVKPYIYTFYLKRGGQYGYRGHVINFYQDVSSIVYQLPRAISTLSECVIFRQQNHDLSGYNDLRVRKNKIKDALEFLIANNIYFSSRISLSQPNLDLLPIDGSIESSLIEINIPVSNNLFYLLLFSFKILYIS